MWKWKGQILSCALGLKQAAKPISSWLHPVPSLPRHLHYREGFELKPVTRTRSWTWNQRDAEDPRNLSFQWTMVLRKGSARLRPCGGLDSHVRPRWRRIGGQRAGDKVKSAGWLQFVTGISVMQACLCVFGFQAHVSECACLNQVAARNLEQVSSARNPEASCVHLPHASGTAAVGCKALYLRNEAWREMSLLCDYFILSGFSDSVWGWTSPFSPPSH